MLAVIFVLFLSVSVSGQPCDDIDGVDITKGTVLRNGSIDDGVIFPPEYVYMKLVDGEWKKFGCLCKIKKCFRKCCPLGFVMYNRTCTEKREFDTFLNNGVDLYDEFDFFGRKRLEDTDFGLVFGKTGSKCYVEDERLFIQKNGELYVELAKGNPSIYGPDNYCIDNFLWPDNTTEISALICYKTPTEEQNYQVSSTCMLISCFFIVLTVAVYAWLPELRNLHGMVLMAYLLSFLVGFIFMATMQIQIMNQYVTSEMCITFTFIIYFSLLSAFFWLNIMCYDIWWTFSGKRAMGHGPSSVHVRFLYYSMYAFGIPLFLTALLAGLEFGIDSNKSLLLPRLRLQGCFLFGKSKLLYLYVPIVILCVANLVFFTLTAMKIAQIKAQSAKTLNKKDKQRFLLYIKLFLVMGVNWILEVVSSFYPEGNYIWRFTDAYNVLVGLIIFIIFVCKVKTLKMIKHRYRQQMGMPPLSRTQTTNTSVSTRTFSQSNKEEFGMLSVNDKERK